jgi:hypothetical protein
MLEYNTYNIKTPINVKASTFLLEIRVIFALLKGLLIYSGNEHLATSLSFIV